MIYIDTVIWFPELPHTLEMMGWNFWESQNENRKECENLTIIIPKNENKPGKKDIDWNERMEEVNKKINREKEKKEFTGWGNEQRKK